MEISRFAFNFVDRRHYQNQAQQNIANTLPVDANFKINIHANYQVSPKFALYVRGENLTNNTSQIMFSYNQTGAEIFGGITLKLWYFHY